MASSTGDPVSILKSHKDLVKYLRFNVSCKTGRIKGERVSYFHGSDAIETLITSKWCKKPHSSGIIFNNRENAIDFCSNLLQEGIIVRCGKNKVEQPNSKEKTNAETSKSKSINDKQQTTKNRKKEVAATKSEENPAKRRKVVRKYKLEIHTLQVFYDTEDLYYWKYNPTSMMQLAMGTVLVIGFVAFNLAPIWPDWMRSGMGFGVWILIALVGFLLIIIVLRFILYYLIWAISCGKWTFWLFPNLHEDCGVVESFIPVYSLEVKKVKKKKSKPPQNSVIEASNEDTINSDDVTT